MNINDHVLIFADDGQVKFHIDQVGQLQMQPETAVDMALRLLNAANELQPGIGGIEWPPRIDWEA